MVRSSRATLADVLATDNLAWATWRAARGKHDRPEVAAYLSRCEAEWDALRAGIHDGSFALGDFVRFVIRDPKLRVIHAPRFRVRVLHHALVHVIGPVLDRQLVDHTYACRVGKGTLRAVRRVQHLLLRQPWYVKIDVRRYFDSIDHAVLIPFLHRRFRDAGLRDLLTRIVQCHSVEPGHGLPIGALTSQHFANAYLGQFDRFLLEELRVRGMVRYMDDVVWFCGDGASAHDSLARARGWLRGRLHLEVKPNARVQRSAHGVGYCGFRVLRGALLLSARRRRRFAAACRAALAGWRDGEVSEAGLQTLGTAAVAITAHAHARGWRRAWLQQQRDVEY